MEATITVSLRVKTQAHASTHGLIHLLSSGTTQAFTWRICKYTFHIIRLNYVSFYTNSRKDLSFVAFFCLLSFFFSLWLGEVELFLFIYFFIYFLVIFINCSLKKKKKRENKIKVIIMLNKGLEKFANVHTRAKETFQTSCKTVLDQLRRPPDLQLLRYKHIQTTNKFIYQFIYNICSQKNESVQRGVIAGWFLGWVFRHIHPCWSFNAKSCLYIYVKYI